MIYPTLEDCEVQMERLCVDVLGDSAIYTPDGAASATIKVFANFREASRAFDGAQAIEQNMMIQVLVADITSKPVGGDRIALPKIPGKIFKPIGVSRDDSGAYWEFELKEVL